MASDSISTQRHSISARNTARQIPLLLARAGLRLWLDSVRRTCAGCHADDGCDAKIRVARNRSVGYLFGGVWNTIRFRGPQPHPFSHALSEISQATSLGRALCGRHACERRRPVVLRQAGRSRILFKSVQPSYTVKRATTSSRVDENYIDG